MTSQNQTQPEQRHGLFRKQAVDKQQDRLLGDVLVVPPISYSLVTFVILIFVAAAAVLLVNGSYARKETVQGILLPDQGSLKVYAAAQGVVRQVFVAEGEWVEEGQPLIVINGDRILETGEHLEALLLEEYQQQLELLNTQLQRIPEVFENRYKELSQNERATEQDIKHLQAQSVLLQQQISLTEQQQTNLNALRNQGLAAQADADQLAEKRLGQQANLQTVLRSLDNQTEQLANFKLQQASLAFEQLSQQEQLERQRSQLTQSIAQIHGQRAHIVKANKAGRVSSLQVKEGFEIQNQIPLLTITPEGSELEAELLVPARAIGFIEPGQSVKLRYSAFNFQKFGLYDATIKQVSDTVLLPQEIRGLALAAQEPMYRVTARLASQSVTAYGKELPLKEGISLEADIKLAERSLLEWLLEPLLSLKGRV